MSVAVLPRIRCCWPKAGLNDTARGIKAVIIVVVLRIYTFLTYEIIGTYGMDPLAFQLSVLILCVFLLRLLSLEFYARLRVNSIALLFQLTGCVVVVALDYLIFRTTEYFNNLPATLLVNLAVLSIYGCLFYSLALREEQQWPIVRLWRDLGKRMIQCFQILQPLAVGALLVFFTNEYPKYRFLWAVFLGCLAIGWVVIIKKKGLPVSAYDAGRLNAVAFILVLVSAITAKILETAASAR